MIYIIDPNKDDNNNNNNNNFQLIFAPRAMYKESRPFEVAALCCINLTALEIAHRTLLLISHLDRTY